MIIDWHQFESVKYFLKQTSILRSKVWFWHQERYVIVRIFQRILQEEGGKFGKIKNLFQIYSMFIFFRGNSFEIWGKIPTKIRAINILICKAVDISPNNIEMKSDQQTEWYMECTTPRICHGIFFFFFFCRWANSLSTEKERKKWRTKWRKIHFNGTVKKTISSKRVNRWMKVEHNRSRYR